MIRITTQNGAETGAEYYYFSLLVPKATCLLDTGGLSLCCCRNILCLFSTQGSLNMHFISKGLSALLQFQSKPPIKHVEMMTQIQSQSNQSRRGVLVPCTKSYTCCISWEFDWLFASSIDFQFVWIFITIALLLYIYIFLAMLKIWGKSW